MGMEHPIMPLGTSNSTSMTRSCRVVGSRSRSQHDTHAGIMPAESWACRGRLMALICLRRQSGMSMAHRRPVVRQSAHERERPVMKTTRFLIPSGASMLESPLGKCRVAAVAWVFLLVGALAGCGGGGDSPDPGATFRGPVHSPGTSSATVEFVVSGDGNSIESFRITYERWTVEYPGGHPGAGKRDGCFEEHTFADAPLLIQDGCFRYSNPRTSGYVIAIDGRFTSATEATGTLTHIQVVNEDDTYEVEDFEWTATAQ